MEIGFFVDRFPNLSETFITHQITALLERGHDVEILAFGQSDGWGVHRAVEEYGLRERTTYVSAPETYADGVSMLATVVPRLLRKGVSPASVVRILSNGTSAPRQLKVLDALLERDQPDVYHSHFGPTGEALRPAAEELGVPLVVSFYGHDVSRAVQGKEGKYEQLFASASMLLALSEEMCQQLQALGAPKAKTHIQPLMIDVDAYSYRQREATEGATKLITVARLVEKKGIEYAVDAVAQLDDYAVEFKIVGDGPRRERIEEKIREHDLQDVVEILGYVDHERVKDLLYESDLFVLPSVTASSGDREGTPTVLLEAQAIGLPVISTHHAGIPEIVDDGDSGLLVPERDSEALAAALRECLECPERWAEMGSAGRKLVRERHSPDNLVESLEFVYANARE